MNPQPVWKRILKALELGSMTIAQLVKCLTTSRRSVEDALRYLRGLAAIEIKGNVTNSHTRPQWLFGLAL